jgi:hypothetical protein
VGRFLLALLPVATFLVVGVLVLFIGAPRPIEAVRVWGGPTDRLARFSGWVEAEIDGRPLANAKLSARARPARGNPAAATATLDADGWSELLLDFDRPPEAFELRIESERGVIGEGRIALSAERWLAAAGRRGGFSHVPQSAPLNVQVAPARGVLAVPFVGALWVRVTERGIAVDQAKVELKVDGAELKSESAHTDRQGLARFPLTPRQHVLTARVNVTTPGGARAELYSSVPVVPGAIEVTLQGAALRVHSPVEREAAFIALVSEQGRWFGARVPLSAVGDGTAVGLLEPPALPSGPLWAVAKSEPSAPSSNCVGWPLFEATEPVQTLDARELLLLDTGPAALKREHDRRRRIRRAALAVGLSGAFISVLAFAWATLRRRQELSSHLARELDDAESAALLPRESGRSLLAIALIILGFFTIVAIAAWRLS